MACFRWLPGPLVVALLGACQPPPPAPILPQQRRLPAWQVLADLVLLQRLKEAAHAGSYKYRRKAQLDSAFAAARACVAGPRTVLDEYRLVVGLTDLEGSLHNDTDLPDSVRRALRAEASFFPYPLKIVAGQVLLNTTQAPLPAGTIIRRIEGVAAPRLVQQLGKYYTTDGRNLTGKTVGFAASFPEYFRLEYGPRASFLVHYSLPAAPARVLAARWPAVPYTTYQRAFTARHSRPSDRGFFEDLPAPYTFQLLPAQRAAVLTINTFELGEANTAGHRRYARFLDSCFTLLHRAPPGTRLLVDVRNNGGGDDDNDMHTFAYLARRPFHENRGATVRFRQVPYRQYLTVAQDTAERAALVADVAQELRRSFTTGPGGQLRENAHGNPVFQPQPKRFRGPLYLLISPRVASAGSMFAAMVRGNTPAVVIGEETMGGYYGHTGHGTLTYTLPYSGIQVTFAWVDLVQDVPVRASQPAGRGVLPDYFVTQSPADFLANRDAQLRFALRLLDEAALGPGH
ncbi:peptidase S41 [Hymenobacter sp. RP-2-7]|uniref:Peptidase S41 n=1 Tax=Hymenobacter polaris TaxID=2682546 RepID=A0A7Y0FKZ0_9BACT|nr:S41 family peptidase [Hymenobacter polaris]NML64228.1 peptidase S41 [Hymenobacter polaris]